MTAAPTDHDEVAFLLAAADRGQWPANSDDAAWEILRNWCFQEECRLADEAEADGWAAGTRALQHQFLPHGEYVKLRGELLRERVRARKLLQSRLRWRYGYKVGRRAGLIRRDVRLFCAARAVDNKSRGQNPPAIRSVRSI
ncbi:hypothetical protein ACFZA2_15360 [Microbacterium sp. NPDC007973]|uniref:hypothetical protein n=1 Tax=Microbacterium sp. NPDC007973 TaxID=3364182 RepID=UPI0036E7A8DB